MKEIEQSMVYLDAEELEDCPCCGKSALLSVECTEDKKYRGIIICTCCGLMYRTIALESKELAIENAVEGWNLRVYK